MQDICRIKQLDRPVDLALAEIDFSGKVIKTPPSQDGGVDCD